MPMMLGTYRYRTVLLQPWVRGLRPDPFFREPWRWTGKQDTAASSSDSATPGRDRTIGTH